MPHRFEHRAGIRLRRPRMPRPATPAGGAARGDNRGSPPTRPVSAPSPRPRQLRPAGFPRRVPRALTAYSGGLLEGRQGYAARTDRRRRLRKLRAGHRGAREAGETLENRLIRIEDATVRSADLDGRIARIAVLFVADIAAVTRERGRQCRGRFARRCDRKPRRLDLPPQCRCRRSQLGSRRNRRRLTPLDPGGMMRYLLVIAATLALSACVRVVPSSSPANTGRHAARHGDPAAFAPVSQRCRSDPNWASAPMMRVPRSSRFSPVPLSCAATDQSGLTQRDDWRPACEAAAWPVSWVTRAGSSPAISKPPAWATARPSPPAITNPRSAVADARTGI